MHAEVFDALKKWIQSQDLTDKKIAELGAYNINGTIKSLLPRSVGYDVVKGPCVDVVIEPGMVPREHWGLYDIVISMGSFQCCSDPMAFKWEIVSLLKTGGDMFLTMCAPSCYNPHRSAPGTMDCIRIFPDAFIELMAPEVKVNLTAPIMQGAHCDNLFIGRKA